MGQELGTLQKFEGCKKQGNVLGEIKSIFHNFPKGVYKEVFIYHNSCCRLQKSCWYEVSFWPTNQGNLRNWENKTKVTACFFVFFFNLNLYVKVILILQKHIELISAD